MVDQHVSITVDVAMVAFDMMILSIGRRLPACKLQATSNCKLQGEVRSEEVKRSLVDCLGRQCGLLGVLPPFG